VVSDVLNAAVTTGWLIDAVIAITVLECLALAVFNRRTGAGVAFPDFLAAIASGLCLMLALRCLARDAGPAWVALFLVAAGVAHGADLRLRWRRRPGCTGGTPLATPHG
jgi:hypothetical protein